MSYPNILRDYRAGALTLAQRLSYRAAGYLAESSARQNGSTLLPSCWHFDGVPTESLPEDLLVLVGITAIALAEVQHKTGGKIDGD